MEINTLADFISEISNLEEYYFRGECKNYKDYSNMASGYRWMKDNNKDFFDLMKLREDFYQEIGYSLSENDKENFIAYSQHHGLPTELLDVTENALVALYFACQSDEKDDITKEDGYVFSLLKSRTLDLGDKLINSQITKQQSDFFNNVVLKIDNLAQPNNSDIEIKDCYKKDLISSIILEKLIEYTRQKDSDVVKEFHDFVTKKRFTNVLDGEVKGYTLANFKKIKKYIFGTKDEKVNIIENENNSLLYHIDNSNMFSSFSLEENINVLYFSFAIHLFFTKENMVFPPLKYLIHQPSVIFDRMINQQGKFIYQNYLIDSGGSIIVQRIEPDYTFKIPARKKKLILQQLDNIGINKKFVYPDHDHIAEYIKEKNSK